MYDQGSLGSCTANATTVSLGQMLTAAGRPLPAGLSAANAVMSEEWAIRFYHACTDQTGDPAQEWPPTDCGSTGLYCCHELMKQGLAGSYKTASGAQNIASLLQAGTVIQGTPYFNAGMEPGPDAFLDGDGSPDALQAGRLPGSDVKLAAIACASRTSVKVQLAGAGVTAEPSTVTVARA